VVVAAASTSCPAYKIKINFFHKQRMNITFVIVDEPDEEVELVAPSGICK
jgi:hypothetical protein